MPSIKTPATEKRPGSAEDHREFDVRLTALETEYTHIQKRQVEIIDRLEKLDEKDQTRHDKLDKSVAACATKEDLREMEENLPKPLGKGALIATLLSVAALIATVFAASWKLSSDIGALNARIDASQKIDVSTDKRIDRLEGFHLRK